MEVLSRPRSRFEPPWQKQIQPPIKALLVAKCNTECAAEILKENMFLGPGDTHEIQIQLPLMDPCTAERSGDFGLQGTTAKQDNELSESEGALKAESQQQTKDASLVVDCSTELDVKGASENKFPEHGKQTLEMDIQPPIKKPKCSDLLEIEAEENEFLSEPGTPTEMENQPSTMTLFLGAKCSTDCEVEGTEYKNYIIHDELPKTNNTLEMETRKRSICDPVGTNIEKRQQRPLLHIPRPVPLASTTEGPAAFTAFKVLYCKRSLKKHKSYCDGILLPKSFHSLLISECGATVTKAQLRISGKPPYKDSDTFVIGGFEGELYTAITQDDYVSGRCFTGFDVVGPNPCRTLPKSPPTHIVEPPTFSALPRRSTKGPHDFFAREKQNFQPPSSGIGSLPHSKLHGTSKVVKAVKSANGQLPPIENFLADHLRPHQQSGLAWMYTRMAEGGGCILADHMGLGKTLQALAILWIFMDEQSKNQGAKAFKALIVCPMTLKGNWKNECKKWLGNRISPLISTCDTKMFSDIAEGFTCSNRSQTLIASYEDIRRVDILCTIDLLICDEGHRLRSLRSQTTIQLQKMKSKRRLLLSGTPLQNNLEELYSCCHFVCPGVLPNEKTFRKVFQEPIIRGCRPDANEAEANLARKRETELMTNIVCPECARYRIRSGVSCVGLSQVLCYGEQQKYWKICVSTSPRFSFFLTAQDLTASVPRKRVVVVHVELSPMHKLAYNEFCKECMANISMARGGCLGLLTSLRRIVNVPEAHGSRQNILNALAESSFQGGGMKVPHEPNNVVCPSFSHPGLQEPSNKLAVLKLIMTELQTGPPEKVVIVSNSTAVLDRIQDLMTQCAWLCLRLDGSTPESARTELVAKFNNDISIQAFLLSSKAGGTGLNLTGASRLVHFDPDWNPANDQQALSRIWRDGQTMPVYIYRLTGAGTVEGHIIRRQLFKNSLAKTFVDGREGSSGRLSVEHIKDILKPIDDPQDSCFTEAAASAFVPGNGPLPLWLEGFHLNETSTLIRKIELEEDTRGSGLTAPMKEPI